MTGKAYQAGSTIPPNTITTSMIQYSAVDGSRLAPDAVQSYHVVDGALDVADVEPSALMALSALNPIHNGGFEVWQRGVSWPAPQASGVHAADRWMFSYVAAGLSVSLSPALDVPAAAALVALSQRSYSVAPGAAVTTIGASEYAFIEQRIEGYTWAAYQQKQFTIGFWVKSAITGTFSVGVTNASQDRSCVQTYTINAANTWEYKTVTFPPSPSSTTGGWQLAAGIGLRVAWVLAMGATAGTATIGSWFTGGQRGLASQTNGINTGFAFKLWGVRMGAGPTVAPYWPRPFGMEALICQRYMERRGNTTVFSEHFGIAYNASATRALLPVPLFVPKRADCTLTASALSTWQLSPGGVPTAIIASAQIGWHLMIVEFTVAGLTTGQGCQVSSSSTSFLDVFANL